MSIQYSGFEKKKIPKKKGSRKLITRQVLLRLKDKKLLEIIEI